VDSVDCVDSVDEVDDGENNENSGKKIGLRKFKVQGSKFKVGNKARNWEPKVG
jgi:hypothetical protein